MSNLKNQIASLAASFTTSVLHALRSASLDEILADAPAATLNCRMPAPFVPPPLPRGLNLKKPTRLPRRTPAQIEAAAKDVATLLKKGPMRAEQIRAALKLDKREMPRVLTFLKDGKAVKTSGQKRATTYALKG